MPVSLLFFSTGTNDSQMITFWTLPKTKRMPSSTDVITTVVDTDPSTYEAKHVHEIYDRIASHFSSTRYKVNTALSMYVSPERLFFSHGLSLPTSSVTYLQDGWALILAPEMENIFPFPSTARAVYGRSVWIEVGTCLILQGSLVTMVPLERSSGETFSGTDGGGERSYDHLHLFAKNCYSERIRLK